MNATGDHGHIIEALEAMADERGEIAFTSNTRDLLTEADQIGLVKPVSGKFRCVEPGCLNSIYRITFIASKAA